MKVVKINPAGTLVLQFPANVEIDAVKHEGKTYVPMFSVEETDEPEAKTEKKKEPVFPEDLPETPKKKSAPVEDEEEKPVAKNPKGGALTEEELTDIPVKDLLRMCEEMGIDPDATDGKNTNKKLRTLILNAKPAKKSASVEEDDDEDEAPAKKGESDETLDAVCTALEDFAAGKKNKVKTTAAICEALSTEDDEIVDAFVRKFEKDESLAVDDIAQEIIDNVKGEATPKKSAGKAEKKEVDVDDLEVGDRVSVYWADENDCEFSGEVKSKKRGKTLIAYDDDTEEVIDPKVHTKIYRL